MKLKLTALLLVLYTGLYAQNKIVLTAPRLDTSSLSNRINLKANTNLNNVNGVLSSTYGGAGIINGILKANGSGVVSAAVNNSDFTLLNGTGFVRMSGTTPSYLTGASSQFLKADGSLDGNTYATTGALSGYLPLTAGSGQPLSGDLWISKSLPILYLNATSGTNGILYNTGASLRLTNNGGTTPPFVYDLTTGATSFGAALSGTSLSMSGATQLATSSGSVLIKTTTDNGTDALQVAGSGLFSGDVTISNSDPLIRLSPTSGTSAFLQKLSAANGDFLRLYDGTDYSMFWRGGNVGIGTTTPSVKLDVVGAITASSSVTATSLIKSGGTSSQFLKADGSVDGSTYLTSAGAVTSIAGTTNQITVSASTGAVTVSLPSAVTISGAMTASSFFESSDLRKKDIVSVTEQADGIDFIAFKWKKELNLDNKKHLGVIAQQVEKVIPDAVTTDEKGFKSVNYTEVMLYKLERMTKKVEELEQKLEKLERKTKKTKN